MGALPGLSCPPTLLLCFDLYRHDFGYWWVGEVLGGRTGAGLRNINKSEEVPTNNWEYVEGIRGILTYVRFCPPLTLTTSLPQECGVITITLHGAAAEAQPSAGGEFRATGKLTFRKDC